MKIALMGYMLGELKEGGGYHLLGFLRLLVFLFYRLKVPTVPAAAG